jgi:hypothetical protein
MIAFYDGVSAELIATVDLDGDKLTISGSEQRIAGLQGDLSADEFMLRAEQGRFSNGYIRTYKVKDGQTPPEKLTPVVRQVSSNTV